MLEIQRIRREKESIIDQLKVVRKVDLSETINKLFILDEEKRDAQKLLDDQSAKMNSISAQIGQKFKEGNPGI